MKRFSRLFGRACGEHSLIQQKDVILVPMDCDGPHLTLYWWLRRKLTRTPLPFKLLPVYFHTSSEPNSDAIGILNSFLEHSITTEMIDLPLDNDHLLKIYSTYSSEHGCNKVAVPDSLNDLDAILLKNLAVHGLITSLPPLQKLKNGIDVIRPLCFTTTNEITTFAKSQKFCEFPTLSFQSGSDVAFDIASRCVEMLRNDENGTLMHLYQSQFSILPEYLGDGSGKFDCE